MKAVARTLAVLAVFAVSFVSQTASAQDGGTNPATVSASWPAGQVQTITTNITGPSNGQQTTFTATSGPWNYVIYPLTVTVSGVYTATSTTTTVVNTTWIVNGIYQPTNTPPLLTPLSAHIVAVLSNGAGTGTFTGFNLVAGHQYSVLVAFNTGSTPAAVSTFSIAGPAGTCIAIGGLTCPRARVPTLSPWALLLLAVLAMGAGLHHMRTRRY